MNPASQTNNTPKKNSDIGMQSVTSSTVRDVPTQQPNGAVPTQTNFEEHQLLYNVLQQLTRKVQERDQLNEVLQQENDKLKLMLMSALDYCYSEMGEPQNGHSFVTPGPLEHFETSPSYPTRKNSNTENQFMSPRSNSSSRKSSAEDNYDPNSPRRNSSGISPRQDQQSPRRSSHGQEYEFHKRRSSSNAQYQQLENYSMTRKSQEQPSFDAIPERKRSSSNGTQYQQMENYTFGAPKRPSQQQDVYGNLGSYKMGAPAPVPQQQFEPSFEQEQVNMGRRASAVPMQSYNLENYVMGRAPPQQQQPQQSFQPLPPQQQQFQDYQYPPQYPPRFDQGHAQERKRSSSNSQSPQYNLEDYSMTRTRMPPQQQQPQQSFQPLPQQQLFPQQEKFFANTDYRRASLAFPPSSKHVHIDPQRSMDESHQQYQFPPYKRMSNPYQNGQPEPFDNPNMARRQSSGTELSQKARKRRSDRDMEQMVQRRQSYGSPPQPLMQQPPMQTQPMMQQPNSNQLQTPDKVFGGDTSSMIPTRRSSVIYTPGPSPKEIRQQQQREQMEKQQALERQIQQQQQLQQQLAQQQQMMPIGNPAPNAVTSLDECETYISDDDEEEPHPQHQSATVDPTASFATYYSDSD